MITIKSKYLGGLRTQSAHERSGKTLLTDAPVDNNGKGEAFSPTDLVCTALVSCMMTVMGIKAQKENFTLEGLAAEVTKVMASSPRKIKEIRIDFFWPHPSIQGEQLAELKKVAIACPVALSVSETIKQEIHFDF